MAEQTERADLARVYRAIGSSKAPMPECIDVRARGNSVLLRFARNDVRAVDAWAGATGGTTARGGTIGEDSDKPWHTYVTEPIWGGTHGSWLGWTIELSVHVDGSRPIDMASDVVLGTGDEPADGAIVPGSAS